MNALVKDAEALSNPILLRDLKYSFAQKIKGDVLKSSDSLVKMYDAKGYFNNENVLKDLIPEKQDQKQYHALIKDIVREQTLINITDKIKEKNSIDDLTKHEIDFLLNAQEKNIQNFAVAYNTELTRALAKQPAAQTPTL